jgi:hypothetical protein
MTNLIIIAAMMYTNAYHNPSMPVVRVEARSVSLANSILTNQQLAIKVGIISNGMTNVVGWFIPSQASGK